MARDLARITETVRRLVPAPPRRGLLLIGGFGRGEGGVHVGEDGRLRAFNDYDLAVVVDGAVRREPLLEAAPALAAELDVDFVDFGFVPLDTLLGRRLDSVYAYELREGHRTLDGPPDLLKAMPAVDPARLPLLEASRLLVNRGYGLAWARLELEEALREAGSFAGRRRRFIVNALHKAVLAIGEAALIAAGRYHYQYRERDRRIDACPLPFDAAESGAFRDAFHASTRFKLAPDVGHPPLSGAGQAWERIRGWHEAAFRWIESRRLDRHFDSWSDWERAISREGLAEAVRRPRRFLSRRASAVPEPRFRDAWLDRDRAFLIRLPALLYGAAGDAGNGRWNDAARRLVEAWHG